MKNRNSLRNNNAVLQKIGVSSCIFAFTLALIRSAVTGITYDEAVTYIRFASRNMLDPLFLRKLYSPEGCIANNHWLNSFLIFFVGKFAEITSGRITYSEFLIRFPILSLYAVYLTAVYNNYLKGNISFFVLIFLVGNYYLNEFYGLARGYGMANTIVLLLFPAVGIICLVRLISRKRYCSFFRKCWHVFAVFVLITLLTIQYHFNISAEGKPLYTGEHNFFNCFFRGFVMMFLSDAEAARFIAWILIVLILLSVVLINKRMSKFDFGLMMIIFILTNLIMELILHKGYIANRILLPFYAFMILAISEIIEASLTQLSVVWKPAAKAGHIIRTALCLGITVLFVSKINLSGTKDWADNYQYRMIINGTYMTGRTFEGERSGPRQFYIKKK